MRNASVLALMVVTAFCALAQAQERHLVLNEAVSSNGSTISSSDGEFYDWIELYNASDRVIPIGGYGLSDRASEPFKWTFPDIEVLPGEYVLVWASGLPDAAHESELHASFRLSAGGEALILSDPDGRQVDFVVLPPIPRDMSFGRLPDGGVDWKYFSVPTPQAPNAGTTFDAISDAPTFSHPSGAYSEEFELTLSTPDGVGTVLYTLDGSSPTPDNVGGRTYEVMTSYPNGELETRVETTYVYTTPLLITSKLGAPNELATIHTTFEDWRHHLPADSVLKATVVRAAVYADGELTSPVVTHTFFVGFEGSIEFDLPILALATDAAGLFDFHEGIYVGGERYNTYLTENPEAEGNPSKFPANYAERGRHTERAAHMELFTPDGTLVFASPLGVRIHGGTTRSRRIKSLRLYARASYGNERFEHAFFPESETSQYETLVLRQAGNDFNGALFRDAMMHRLVAETNLDTQAYLPVVVFLNGEYWGIHNLRERYDLAYLVREYGLDEDEIDLLTRRWHVVSGGNSQYLDTLEFFESADLETDEAYARAQTLIDVENLIDYYIAETYFGNIDWPNNNVDFFRKRTDEYVEDAPVGHDGRWRWLLYDTDLSFRHYESTTLEDIANGVKQPKFTVIFRSLLRNEQFRQRFVDRYDHHLRTTFQPDRVIAIIDQMASRIESEVPRHVERWGVPRSVAAWEREVETLREFARQRPAHIWAQVEAAFPEEAARVVETR